MAKFINIRPNYLKIVITMKKGVLGYDTLKFLKYLPNKGKGTT